MARRTKEEALETRERLLESALHIMSEKPFSSVSMDEIAKKIGLSKGAVYWHFKNKGDIVVNLMAGLCAQAKNELCADSLKLETPEDIRLYFKNKLRKTAQSGCFKKMNMLMRRRWEWPEDVCKKVIEIALDGMEQERLMVENALLKLQREAHIKEDVSARELSRLITTIFRGLAFVQVSGLCSSNLAAHIADTDFIFDAFEKELTQDIEKEKVR